MSVDFTTNNNEENATMTIAQTKAVRRKIKHDPRRKHKGKRSVEKSDRKASRQKEKQSQMAARKAKSGGVTKK
ncbi:MAG: hypothetical protein HYY60_01765 [Parcubacteria group bacterium]|nr:hypothetical protein [Parcubacteria group bacterium]